MTLRLIHLWIFGGRPRNIVEDQVNRLLPRMAHGLTPGDGCAWCGMDLAAVCEFCQDLPGAVEDAPFGPDVLVYKVGGKLFALTDPQDHPLRVNLKCDPDRAVELREEYEAVRPGYHMNKKHWNTVVLDGSLPSALVRELVQHSYDLVRGSLSAAMRRELER